MLKHPALCTGQEVSNTTCLDLQIVQSLLTGYLKPLFQATASNRIHSTTGRAAKPIANLVDAGSSRGAPLEDDVMWKGGDMDSAQRTTIIGGRVLEHVDGGSNDSEELLRTRHAALGCTGVLYVCCSSLQIAAQNAQGAHDPWTDHWPFLLPPLLQLLEDPTPRYRLLGTCILAGTLLGYPLSRMSTLLLRTGIAPLFQQCLETNLTHISHKLAPPLLDATADAWVRLAELTTDTLYGHSTLPNVQRDGGRARYDRLSKLMDEGVLRVWAYSPSSINIEDIYFAGSDGLDSESTEHSGRSHDRNHTTKYDSTLLATYESDDSINTTMDIVIRLARQDVLGIGIVRYMNVVLDFLVTQLAATLEAKVVRWRQKPPSTGALPNVAREWHTARALNAFIQASSSCPALDSWIPRTLLAVARCWTLLADIKKESGKALEQHESLKKELANLVELSRTIHSDHVTLYCERLVAVDRELFQPLCLSISATVT